MREDNERKGTEFKSSVTNRESIAKTVCAFLNTKGGTVFYGVDSNGKIVGIEDAESHAKQLHTFLMEEITPKSLFSVTVDEEEGKNILSIEVPEGKDRPYVYKGTVYVRYGSQTRTADSATLRNMVQAKSVESERWELRPSVAMEEDDLDKAEIFRTGEEARVTGMVSFSNPDDAISVLQGLSMYSSKGFTQAADVLFSINPGIRHPQTRVRATRYNTDKGAGKYLDNRVFQGPLVQVLNEVLAFISRNIAVISLLPEDQLRRQDRPEYPMSALREGLVNAFAHRDYSGFSGGLAVSIYPSRIEIWNSGHLPDGLKPGDLCKNHPSLPTNPDIAHVFYLRGLMERVGRGTQKIINACREYVLPAPRWTDQPTGVTLTLYSARGFAKQDADPNTDQNIALNMDWSFVPNARQGALLNALSFGEEIRPGDYQERFAHEVSERQARRDLKELENAGFFTRIGGGPETRYRRTNRTGEKPWEKHGKEETGREPDRGKRKPDINRTGERGNRT